MALSAQLIDESSWEFHSKRSAVTIHWFLLKIPLLPFPLCFPCKLPAGHISSHFRENTLQTKSNIRRFLWDQKGQEMPNDMQASLEKFNDEVFDSFLEANSSWNFQSIICGVAEWRWWDVDVPFCCIRFSWMLGSARMSLNERSPLRYHFSAVLGPTPNTLVNSWQETR